jgi:hypothetical protein
MKRSLTLALVLTSISAIAFAQTSVPAAAPTSPIAMPAPAQGSAPMPPHGNMMNQDRMKTHMEHMFDEMDTNHDGVISKEESTAFGARKFDERDANHDGKVTKAEWIAFNEAMAEKFKEKMQKMGDMPMHTMPDGTKMGGAAMPAGAGAAPAMPNMGGAKPVAPTTPVAPATNR